MSHFSKFAAFFLFLSISLGISAQSILDDISADEESIGSSALATEKIEKISVSKRIFILSNNERSYSKGDFISLVFNNELVCRALVAKDKDAQSGVKIIKFYNLDLWNKLSEGTEVKVIRGDDSFFRRDKKSQIAESKITDEDDLFNDTTLEDSAGIDDNKKRAIKTDNLVSLALGFIEGPSGDDGSSRYNQISAFWAYQIDDNIYIEGGYGQNIINDYPSTGLDTKLNSIVLRAKYTFSAPLYSFLQPYLGFQIVGADSPGAGAAGTGATPPSDAELDLEIEKVEDLKKKSVVFGVTLLKRLVPGWFFRADLGSDMLSAGFSLEF